LHFAGSLEAMSADTLAAPEGNVEGRSIPQPDTGTAVPSAPVVAGTHQDDLPLKSAVSTVAESSSKQYK